MIGVACATLFAGATAAGAKPHEGDHPNNGNHGSSAAAKLCAASKKADHAAFKAVWGKHAMRDCIRANRGTEPTAVDEGTSDFVNAARECRAAREPTPGVRADIGQRTPTIATPSASASRRGPTSIRTAAERHSRLVR